MSETQDHRPDPDAAGEDVAQAFASAYAASVNDSGIVPFEFKVLVEPDESEVAKAARQANILVPDTAQGMYQAGTVTGRVVAVSEAAFSYHDWSKAARLPRPGDRVVFARYAGMLVKGKPYKNAHGRDEQREYRLVNDKDIAGILEF